MKSYTIYECDYCNFKTKDFNEAEEHEAAHLNLTVKEMHDYNALKSFVNFMRSEITRVSSNCEKIPDEFLEEYKSSLKELETFKKVHKVSDNL